MVVQYIISKVFSKQNFWWILFFEIPTAWRHNDVISKNTHYLRFVYEQYIKSKIFLRRIHFLFQNFRFMGLWRHNGVIKNNTAFSKALLKKRYLCLWLEFLHFFNGFRKMKSRAKNAVAMLFLISDGKVPKKHVEVDRRKITSFSYLIFQRPKNT